jgi:hypothetical protein
MPISAEAQNGRIIPVNVNYCKTVYVTSDEKRKLDCAYALFEASCVVVVLIAGIRVYRRNKS